MSVQQKNRLSLQQKKELSAKFEESFSYIKKEIIPYIPNIGSFKNKFLIQFNILLDLCGPCASMLDLGCGHGFLAMIMSSIGWKVYGIDNQQDYAVNYKGDEIMSCLDKDKKLWEYFGFNFIKQDIYEEIPFSENFFDVIVCSDVLEHLLNSPKPVLENAVRKLRKGGYFMIQTPNSVNIKKRVKVLCGRINYPPLDDWYYNGSPWVGHVREPSLSELKKIMMYCKLVVYKAYGHNFIGGRNLPKSAQTFANFFAKMFPSLAAHILVIGKKV